MRVLLNLFCLVIAVLAFHARSAGATPKQTCQKIYVATAQACSGNTAQIAPGSRAHVQQACVKNAQEARSDCENDSSGVCINQCQDTYNNEVNNVCPANCGTDGICLDVCNANAQNAFNACTAACP